MFLLKFHAVPCVPLSCFYSTRTCLLKAGYFIFYSTLRLNISDLLTFVTSSNSALAYKFHCSVNSLLYVNSEPNKTSMLSALLC